MADNGLFSNNSGRTAPSMFNSTTDVSIGSKSSDPMLRRKPVPSPASPASPPSRTPATKVGAFLIWRWEIICFCIVLGLLAGIFITLDKFNGKEYPKWDYRINLNTLVAVYTTTLRSLLRVPIAEVIGQGRWSWFDRPQRLSDIEHYDRASRGAWGSMRLLFLSWRPGLATVSALVTIVSLAIGPFAQQAVRTELCDQLIPDASASVPISRYAPGDGVETFNDRTVWSVSSNVASAFVTGIIQPNAVASTNILDASCGTGNCTFPDLGGFTYETLGICSRCTDATAEIFSSTISESGSMVTYHINDSTGNLMDIAPGVNYNSFTIRSNLGWPSSGPGPEDHHILKTDILGFSGYDGSSIAPQAARCTLYPCLKSIDGHFKNGYLSETVVKESFPEVGDFNPFNYTIASLPCVVDGTSYTSIADFQPLYDSKPDMEVIVRNVSGTDVPIPVECAYQIGWGLTQGLSAGMRDWLTGDCSISPMGRAGDTRCSRKIQSEDPSCVVNKLFWLNALENKSGFTAEFAEKTWFNLATALTNRMRNVGLGITSQERLYIQGVATHTAVCTRFDAYWLLLPSALAFITGAVLCAAVTRSVAGYRHEPTWKSSTLPLLFYGVSNNGENQSGKSDIEYKEKLLSLREMRRQARQTSARFQKGNGEGVGFIYKTRHMANGATTATTARKRWGKTTTNSDTSQAALFSPYAQQPNHLSDTGGR